MIRKAARLPEIKVPPEGASDPRRVIICRQSVDCFYAVQQGARATMPMLRSSSNSEARSFRRLSTWCSSYSGGSDIAAPPWRGSRPRSSTVCQIVGVVSFSGTKTSAASRWQLRCRVCLSRRLPPRMRVVSSVTNQAPAEPRRLHVGGKMSPAPRRRLFGQRRGAASALRHFRTIGLGM